MAITKIQSESLNLADTYDFTGTVTGAGESNIPYFQLNRSSSQTGISDGVNTKIQFDQAQLDTANGADVSTNYRYTIQSGDAGKYFIIGKAVGATSSDTDNKDTLLSIFKNGSSIAQVRTSTNSTQDLYRIGNTVYTITDLAVGDYLELYISINSSSNVNTQRVDSSNSATFSGFKLSS